MWHRRLAHPSNQTLNSLLSTSVLPCNKRDSFHLCSACQFAKHTKLPFSLSNSTVTKPFEIIHSDLWTSLIQSLSGIKYYVLFLDQYSHFLWVYPLRYKHETFSKFLHFSKYVKNQFGTKIKSLQCDNGGEFDNSRFHDFFASNGMTFRFSCPYTSQQNGKSERMIYTINNAVRSLLLQAQLPSSFWVEALHTAVHILNILPTKTLQNRTPFSVLFKKLISYSHLKVFGCLCYPNINHSHHPKLSPRSSKCIFIGYPTYHRGYRCFDLSTKKIIISRNVTFDEGCFLYETSRKQPDSHYDFLRTDDEPSPLFKSLLEAPAATPSPLIVANPPSEEPTPPTQVAREAPRHAMSTRSKHGISKPKQILSLHTEAISPLPKSYIQALNDPNWNPSMTVAYDAIVKSETFDLVPRPANTNIVRSMWLHKHKYDAEGRFKKHKSRLVANGKSQEHGIDFDETFSPVVRQATIRTLLHVALVNGWQVNQLDV